MLRLGAVLGNAFPQAPNAPVNWQQRAQHVDVQLNAELGW